MRARVVRLRARRLGKGRGRVHPDSRMEMVTEDVHRAWCPRLLTNSKKLLCGASAANSNRHVWQAQETRNPCNKSCAARRRLVATILALAGQGRNIRSATGREARRRFGCPILVAFFATGWG